MTAVVIICVIICCIVSNIISRTDQGNRTFSSSISTESLLDVSTKSCSSNLENDQAQNTTENSITDDFKEKKLALVKIIQTSNCMGDGTIFYYPNVPIGSAESFLRNFKLQDLAVTDIVALIDRGDGNKGIIFTINGIYIRDIGLGFKPWYIKYSDISKVYIKGADIVISNDKDETISTWKDGLNVEEFVALLKQLMFFSHKPFFSTDSSGKIIRNSHNIKVDIAHKVENGFLTEKDSIKFYLYPEIPEDVVSRFQQGLPEEAVTTILKDKIAAIIDTTEYDNWGKGNGIILTDSGVFYKNTYNRLGPWFCSYSLIVNVEPDLETLFGKDVYLIMKDGSKYKVCGDGFIQLSLVDLFKGICGIE